MSAGPLLLVAAGVHTLDEATGADGPVRALLIEHGRVTWVGAPEQAPPTARSIDLGGGWVTPGFVDAHVHATATGLAARGVDLAGAASREDMLARIRAHPGDDAVLTATGWDDFAWPRPGPPSPGEIAEAAPGRTVICFRVDAHSCVVDAGTLTRLPLSRLDGVERDRDGAPTGWLREQACEAAWSLVREQIAEAQLRAARGAACGRAAALGIVSLHEMGHPGLSSLEDARTWARGDWPLDVVVWWAELDVARALDHGLRPGGDLFLDGSIGSRTAAVSCGYRDGGDGQLFHGDEEVAHFFDEATAAGVGAGVHAIGDRAVEQAVMALEHAAVRHGVAAVAACRHRVEHLELATRAQVARLARLGVIASVQPAFDAAWGGPAGMYAERFGIDVAVRSNPLRWFADAGVPLAFGSDSTVTPLDPWGAVVAAERHRGGLGLDRGTALAAHTVGGRRAAGQDDAGRLRVGAPADLAVWDADPLTVPDPRALHCLATLVAGEAVHGDIDTGA